MRWRRPWARCRRTRTRWRRTRTRWRRTRTTLGTLSHSFWTMCSTTRRKCVVRRNKRLNSTTCKSVKTLFVPSLSLPSLSLLSLSLLYLFLSLSYISFSLSPISLSLSLSSPLWGRRTSLNYRLRMDNLRLNGAKKGQPSTKTKPQRPDGDQLRKFMSDQLRILRVPIEMGTTVTLEEHCDLTL